jgi:hypothetical protein
MIFQSNYTDRQLFNQANAAMLKANVSPTALANAVLTQSVMTLIQPITTGQQFIQFPVLNNQQGAGGATRLDEVRLSQQNAFFVGQIQFTLFKSASFNYIPNTYPNAVTYTNAANYYTIYNGKISVNIDNSIVLPAYSMRKFLNIPQTQLTAAANSPQDQFDGTAMMPWEPNIVFVGTAQTDITIVLPASLGTIDANSFGRFDLFGVLGQNVALGAIQS